MATLSLLSRVIESEGEDTEISSIKDRVQVTRAGPFTQMVSVHGTGGGSLVGRVER